ncbi:MAG: zinc-binding alcohol dehydrogenase family protein [Sphingobium sp.]
MAGTMMAGVASPDGLEIRAVSIPQPGPDQLLVRVAAAGMNRADINAARGAGVANPDAFGRPIGMEWAGEVVAAGDGADMFAPGDWVACSGSGGYAAYALADKGRALRFDPAQIAPRDAAILPLALATAHNALLTAGRFTGGDSVLVHGASSAVGLATARIARLLGARTVIGTSTSPMKRDKLASLPEFDIILDPGEGWSRLVLDATDGRGANVVVDMVSGAGLNETFRATAILGRVVNVGRLGGLSATIDMDLHAARRIDYRGVTFRTRSLPEIRELVAAMAHDLWPAVEAGQLRLPVDRDFPLAQAREALGHMAGNGHFGKIALIP